MEGWGSPFERANILATGVERLTKERDDLLALLGARKMGVDKLHAENSELRKQLADAIRSVILARDMLDPGGDMSLKDALFALGEHIEIGKRWRANNSLEEWFPFSAQKLKSLEVECGNAAAIILKQDAEINSLRAQLEQPNDGAMPRRQTE